MSKVRDDVRSAFDREQTALGEVGDARHRLMRNALAARDVPASHGLQWATGIAAVLIAVIVIATFAIARANSQSHVLPAATPSPKAVVSPTPLRNQIGVPAATPLILYHDPVNFDQLDGTTWDGKLDGRVGGGVTNGGLGNPQGSSYTTMGDIRDRSGAVVATYDAKNEGIFWADDGVHFCDVVRILSRDVTGPGTLQTGAVGQPRKNVTQIGTFAAANLQGGGPTVVACSPAGDRAVVYQAPPGGVGVVQIWVIQLSTGRKLWTGGSGGWIVASHDGKYVALDNGSGQTTIYGPNGAALAHLAGTVFGFSWDGTLAVVAQNFGSAPSIVNWSDGQTVWTCPDSSLKYWESFAEPGGSHIAIGVLDPAYPQTGGFAPVDLFVVGSDGIVAFERKDVTLFSQ
jgi:hypothetical protein